MADTLILSTPETSQKEQPLDKQNLSTTALILSRHSTRAFIKDRPVPSTLLEESLSLARNAPSSTNHQPWRLYILSGERLESVRSALTHAFSSGVASTTPETPQAFRPYRSELGHELYGERGYNIARGDREGMRKAQMRNYSFFDAPTVAVICIPKVLCGQGFLAETLSVGLYVQTLVLLLAERGLGTCLQVAPAGFGETVKTAAGITDDVEMICTLDIGYEDASHQINTVRARRDEWKDNVKFIS